MSAVGVGKTEGAHMEKQHLCQILLHSAPKEHATIGRHTVFWLCNDDKQIVVVLPDNWEGLSAQIMITGQIIVLSA